MSALCYKGCGDYIVIMKKLPNTICNESRRNIADPMHANFRANKLLVIGIVHKITGKEINRVTNTTYHKEHIEYIKSKVVATDYDLDPDKICAPGIHYFLSVECAFFWGKKGIGKYRTWYNNGQKFETATYRMGLLHGPYLQLYQNGLKCIECILKEGKIHGLYQLWHKNGQIKKKCTYNYGQMNGSYQEWFENGQITKNITYRYGRMNGPYQERHKNGQKMIECSYLDDKLHGSYQRFYQSGQTHIKCMYHNDKLFGLYQRFYSNGQKLEEFHENPSGFYRHWDHNGKKLRDIGKYENCYRIIRQSSSVN